ncbi:hypothetical protein LEP1GSC132_0006 [Leptospira kirschneri str. 200803703]|uniref:AcrVA2 family anti-CRISPR protein n=1 Tax=Leptospira kirschneri TaxID=29507 RepID=UPI0002BD3872|nr:hypothetical protein [Leptospira kirschneri]EMO66612.1 hypothetical protein LEP1GSC132_0006 [Leptospira kirschneri str. 200803703]
MANTKKTLKRKDRKKVKSRPEMICNELLSLVPHYKEVLKITLENKNSWNKNVFAPLAAYFPILFDENPKSDSRFQAKMILLQRLAAIIPWSLSKSIYRFTNELSEELINSELPEKIPCEALKLLPYWSIYIELKNQEINDCKGFFVHLDTHEGLDEIRILLDFEEKPPYLLILLLKDNCTIEESLKILTNKISKNYFEDGNYEINSYLNASNDVILEYYKKIIPLILYINSESSDIVGDYSYTKYKKRTKDKMEVGINLDPSSYTISWEAGKNYSQSLKLQNGSVKEINKEITKSPHIRRSHWHHYWVGSGDNRRLTLYWIPPTSINSQ